MQITRVGFIGLGNMGRPIANNLARSDFALQVFDLDAEAVAEVVGLGAVSAPSPATMAAACEVVCLCVRDDAQVEQVLKGADGVFQGAQPGLHVLLHSTVSAGALRRWRDEAAARGIVLADVSVTGGPAATNARQLCYIVGADEATFEHIRPVLEPSACAGGAVVHAGPVGAGLALKLANNAMAFFAFAAMHEGARLVAASGGSVEKLIEVGTANGVVTTQMRAFMDNRKTMLAQYSLEEFRQRYAPMAKLVEKDMRYAVASGEELGVAMPCSHYILGALESVFLDVR